MYKHPHGAPARLQIFIPIHANSCIQNLIRDKAGLLCAQQMAIPVMNYHRFIAASFAGLIYFFANKLDLSSIDYNMLAHLWKCIIYV